MKVIVQHVSFIWVLKDIVLENNEFKIVKLNKCEFSFHYEFDWEDFSNCVFRYFLKWPTFQIILKQNLVTKIVS